MYAGDEEKLTAADKDVPTTGDRVATVGKCPTNSPPRQSGAAGIHGILEDDVDNDFRPAGTTFQEPHSSIVNPVCMKKSAMAHSINQSVSKSALVIGFPAVFKVATSCCNAVA